jgi:hypothetical protein
MAATDQTVYPPSYSHLPALVPHPTPLQPTSLPLTILGAGQPSGCEHGRQRRPVRHQSFPRGWPSASTVRPDTFCKKSSPPGSSGRV